MSDQATAPKIRAKSIKRSIGSPFLTGEEIILVYESSEGTTLPCMTGEPSDPALLNLLTKFGELIEADRLPMASFSEWEKGVAASEKAYEGAKRIGRLNREREANA